MIVKRPFDLWVMEPLMYLKVCSHETIATAIYIYLLQQMVLVMLSQSHHDNICTEFYTTY